MADEHNDTSTDVTGIGDSPGFLVCALLAIFVLVSWVSGYTDATLAAGLVYVAWTTYQHQRTFAHVLDVSKMHREAIDAHMNALDLLLDEHGKLQIKRAEDRACNCAPGTFSYEGEEHTIHGRGCPMAEKGFFNG